MNKNLTITDKDLNVIDIMNSSAKVNTKNGEIVFNMNNGDTLKGSLGFANGGYSFLDERRFIEGERRKYQEYLTERFTYENLPEGITKYRLERKLIENGQVAIIKAGLKYYALNFTVAQWNIYDEPTKIIITEPRSKLNGLKYGEEQFIVIRNNLSRKSDNQRLWRFLSSMERTLFQLEKNLTSSAPKGILDLSKKDLAFEEGTDSSLKKSLEKIANSQDTFHVLKSTQGDKDYSPLGTDESKLFTPIELTDRTENLIRSYSFFKKEIKEYLGANTDDNPDKKERKITTEIDSQQAFSNTGRQHAFNIRELDIKSMNDKYGLNTLIDYQSDTREEVEETTPPQEQPEGDQ